MIDSLYIGATGMHSQQMNIDIVANNLANVNTAGFKKNRVDFEDLLYRNVTRANGLVGNPDNTHRIGLGSAVAATGKVFTVGDLKKTDAPLDLAITGPGFFEVVQPDGSLAYTRNGSFEISEGGKLATSDGHLLSAMIQIPSDARSILVQPDGRVLIEINGESQPILAGQIELANFTNPAGLNPLGDNLYVPTDKSGDSIEGLPGDNGMGTIAQGFQEASNVKLIEEMVNLIMAQRAYEINAKVVQASDQILSISNSLYR